MTIQTRDLRFARKAFCVALFFTIVSITAQAAPDNPPAQSSGKPQAEQKTEPTEEGSKTSVVARSLPALPADKNSPAAERPPSATGDVATKPAGQSSSDEWQFQFTPYLFAASLKGDVGARGFTNEVDARFVDIIDEVNFGFMAAFEARKNRFIFLADTQYLNLSDSRDLDGLVFSSVKADVKLFTLDPEVGYRLVDSEAGSLDVLGGFRYWHLNLRLDFRAGLLGEETRAEQGKNWVDAVGGLRGRARLSDSWFLTGKVDLGGGGSDFTWQLFGGVGAHLGDHISLILGYRYLKVDYDDDQGFLFDVALKGPVLGFGFRW